MLNQFHVLIVDDVVENIQVAMNVLKEDGYNLSFAMNGEEALNLIQQNPKDYDLILLDIMMPVKNGFEVCKTLINNPATEHIPVIFLSAKADIDSISKCFKVGAVDYISKPFHADELLARVKTHVTLYHAKRLLKANNIQLETKIEHTTKRLIGELESSQRDMIFVLLELLASNSIETAQQVKHIAYLSRLLGRLHPALTDDDAELLFDAAPLHDIGKITIPNDILHKEGKYTPEDFSVMKQHTEVAFEILSRSKRRIMEAAALIAYQHHEKWDGTGYPQGLAGEDIHIFGRIVGLVDVYDALITAKPHKPAWEPEQALNYIVEQSGKHFDPELVTLFQENFEEIKQIC